MIMFKWSWSQQMEAGVDLAPDLKLQRVTSVQRLRRQDFKTLKERTEKSYEIYCRHILICIFNCQVLRKWDKFISIFDKVCLFATTQNLREKTN